MPERRNNNCSELQVHTTKNPPENHHRSSELNQNNIVSPFFFLTSEQDPFPFPFPFFFRFYVHFLQATGELEARLTNTDISNYQTTETPTSFPLESSSSSLENHERRNNHQLRTPMKPHSRSEQKKKNTICSGEAPSGEDNPISGKSKLHQIRQFNRSSVGIIYLFLSSISCAKHELILIVDLDFCYSLVELILIVVDCYYYFIILLIVIIILLFLVVVVVLFGDILN